ncbi:hypothetical protein BZB76_3609 [Actinomadura pelletieri DSM 43383]|uniref:Secreted protein n=1 Tax=Actinomadura pelletieri DSM 43383 TaxID=1120940 RepID=A0A495QQ57_9ACTN|nr:hypothetical protein [Actinomadura pelletieri]RKS75081.1 hypothetical protein BZB76_3609 [Actinomadura pelletieri DSM 43383]
MSAVLLNVLIGLVTSILSGGGVWLLNRVKQARRLQRKAVFFGLEGGAPCVVVMNDKASGPGSTAHDDVHALVEIAMLGRELGSPVDIRKAREFHESNGTRTEFCVGGPEGGSNPRTGGHLAAHLPGVTLTPFTSDEDRLAFVVDGETFRCARGQQERALVAKFRPTPGSRPVFIICGHTSLANRAAVHFLKSHDNELAASVESVEQFCLIIKVDAIPTYGFQAATLERDVTRAAFAPGESRRPEPHMQEPQT